MLLKYLRLLSVSFLLLCCFVVTAQTVVMPDEKTQTDTQSLPEKLQTIEKSLGDLQSHLDNLSEQQTQKSIAELLKQLPVNATTIEARINDLSQKNAPPIEQAQIKSIEKLIDNVDKNHKINTEQLANLKTNKQILDETIAAIDSLQQLLSNPVNQAALSTAENAKVPQLQQQAQTLLARYQQQMLTQEKNLGELSEATDLLKRWKTALSGTQQAQQQERQNDLQNATQESRLAEQQQRYEDDIANLQERLSSERKQMDLNDIEAIQQQLYSKQILVQLLSVDKQLAELLGSNGLANDNYRDADELSGLSMAQLSKAQQQIQTTQTQLRRLSQTLETDFADFKQRAETLGENASLTSAFQQRQRTITYLQLQLQGKPEKLTNEIAKRRQQRLLSRDTLYRENNWQKGLQGIDEALLQIAYQVKISFQTLYQQVWTAPYRIVALALAGIALAVLLVRLLARTVSNRSIRYIAKAGLIATLRKLFYVLRKHVYTMIFLLFIVALVRVSEMPSPGDNIIRALVYSLGALLTWWEFTTVEVRLGNLSKAAARRSHLSAVVLVLFTLLYTLSYLSAVASATVEIYEKLLMLAMIVFTVVMKHNLRYYLDKSKARINSKAYHVYLRFIDTVPWLIIAVCLLSLAGYGQLAWLILGYIGIGTLYLLTAAVGIITINLVRKKLKLYSLRQFAHGAFIAQDIVSPLSTIAKGLWLWLTTALLFHIVGWSSNSYLIVKGLAILNHPLFSFDTSTVTLLTIILLFLSVYLIFRIAKWLRTFSYHWLYARIQDLGVRNSLSIFSQYVAALLGVLISLNVLGIDLTSLAVFAGALGVGVGLGLQDIAKNFISGILLLVERPLRNGDWVAIDGSEGTVKSIGMRAITLETFDKQDVIIPNSNTISSSFTNNTHSNSITRTVLYVGAGYGDEPDKVLKVLNDIITQTEAILADPEPQIVMWEYADSSINYRIQYFIDINAYGLFSTKTAVLKAIWYAFEEQGIDIPFPQRDVNIKPTAISNKAPIAESDKDNDKDSDDEKAVLNTDSREK